MLQVQTTGSLNSSPEANMYQKLANAYSGVAGKAAPRRTYSLAEIERFSSDLFDAASDTLNVTEQRIVEAKKQLEDLMQQAEKLRSILNMLNQPTIPTGQGQYPMADQATSQVAGRTPSLADRFPIDRSRR